MKCERKTDAVWTTQAYSYFFFSSFFFAFLRRPFVEQQQEEETKKKHTMHKRTEKKRIHTTIYRSILQTHERTWSNKKNAKPVNDYILFVGFMYRLVKQRRMQKAIERKREIERKKWEKDERKKNVKVTTFDNLHTEDFSEKSVRFSLFLSFFFSFW